MNRIVVWIISAIVFIFLWVKLGGVLWYINSLFLSIVFVGGSILLYNPSFLFGPSNSVTLENEKEHTKSLLDKEKELLKNLKKSFGALEDKQRSLERSMNHKEHSLKLDINNVFKKDEHEINTRADSLLRTKDNLSQVKNMVSLYSQRIDETKQNIESLEICLSSLELQAYCVSERKDSTNHLLEKVKDTNDRMICQVKATSLLENELSKKDKDNALNSRMEDAGIEGVNKTPREALIAQYS